jgi:hypothetical protein
VNITSLLAADLRLLTAALDEPGADIAGSLRQLATDTAAAVPSYLGLSVIVSRSDRMFTFTNLTEGVAEGAVRTSLRLTVRGVSDGRAPPQEAIILYAGSPGTFVDLAADLAWLTARPPSDFVLDEHLTIRPGPHAGTPLAAESIINQAIGVLIGRDHTPEQARAELDTQAVIAGSDRHSVARLILATLDTTAEDSGHVDQDVNGR